MSYLTQPDLNIKQIKWVKWIRYLKSKSDPIIKWVKWIDPFITQTCLAKIQIYLWWVEHRSD